MSTRSKTIASSSMKIRLKALVAIPVLGIALIVGALQAQEETVEKETRSTWDVAAFFADLAGSSWELRGEWTGGGAFHQIKELAWGLDGRIVKVRTFVPDADGVRLVLRSEGIRAPDRTTGGWRFFEFDRDGGIVYGPIDRTETSLYYEYDYFVGGELRTLRDAWIRTGDAGLVYRVGIWEDGGWEQILLTAEATPIALGAGPVSEQPVLEPPATEPEPEVAPDPGEDASDTTESATTEEPDGQTQRL